MAGWNKGNQSEEQQFQNGFSSYPTTNLADSAAGTSPG